MAKRPPTADERELHRVRIASEDLTDAVQFIDAAIASLAAGTDPRKDITHKALLCAALIHYARPFSGNEHPDPKQRPRHAAASRLDIKKILRGIITTPERRKVHHRALHWRNKLVAHAESRYYPVKMIKPEWPDPSALAGDYAFLSSRPLLDIDLKGLRTNARELQAYLIMQTVALAARVRKRKRLRPIKRPAG